MITRILSEEGKEEHWSQRKSGNNGSRRQSDAIAGSEKIEAVSQDCKRPTNQKILPESSRRNTAHSYSDVSRVRRISDFWPPDTKDDSELFHVTDLAVICDSGNNKLIRLP